jgi:succinate-acetate transporter protein
MSTTSTTTEPVAPAAPLIADPAPLGLAGFAMTTFVLSVFNANILGTKDAGLELVVLPLALFYGGIAQFAAGMWEFKNRNTFGALAFSSYGAFWMAFAAYVKYVAGGLGPDANKATGLFLLAWTIFTFYMTIAALRTNLAVFAVFLVLLVTFLFLTIGAFDTATTVNTFTHIGGWLGLITAVLAWYTSAAIVTNFTFGRTVLPLIPLARTV